MTRINTNVSSLVAQKNLQKSNVDLQTALTRLSTGLRINVGKDDPAGLIASETLRSDIISVKKAISNSERANQLIGTADSALGQVSALLNDIRGLVTEAANSGALSSDQIQANQLQIDSSLEAIDRIAQITAFQGRRLLDGSLDFLTTGVSSDLQDLEITQANFGTLSQIGVSVEVATQATKGQLTYVFDTISEDVVLQIGGSDGTEAFSFAANSTTAQIADAVNLVSDALGVSAEVVSAAAQAGSINVSSFGGDNDILLTAKAAGIDAGNINVVYDASTAGQTLASTYTAQSGGTAGTIVITLETQADVAATGDYTQAGVNNDFTVTANVAGSEFNDVRVSLVTDAGGVTFTYDHNDVGGPLLTIGTTAAQSTADIIAALAAVGNEDIAALFTIANVGESDGSGLQVLDTGAVAITTGGIDGGAILSTANDVIAEINAKAVLQDDVLASLATSNDGHDVVTDFDEYIFSGTEAANNLLQFLAPDGTRDIRFVSTANTASLSVDTATVDPQTTDNASAVVQGVNADATFVVTAVQQGSAFDDVSIVVTDTAGGGATDNVVYDATTKTLTIDVDVATVTANDVVTLINGDTYVNDFFTAANFGGSAGGGLVTVASAGTTSGGITNDGTVVVNLATNANGTVTTTAQDLIDFFDDTANAAQLSPLGISVSNAEDSDGSGLLSATTVGSDLEFATNGRTFTDANSSVNTFAVAGSTARVLVTAIDTGADFDDVTVVFTDTATSGSETFDYNSTTKTLTIGIEEGVTQADDLQVELAKPANSVVAALFTIVGAGAGLVDVQDTGVTSGGVTIGGNADGAAFLDAADAGDGGLQFTSIGYGSIAFVSIKALSGTFTLTDSTGATSDRSVGTDIDARINGIQAIGDGLLATLNTSSLDLSFTVAETVADGASFSFNITGGGAKFQLGPEVVSNQQARLGIASVNTATLGGVSGKLFELKSGGIKAIDADIGGAAKVVDEVISSVTSLRGRLGAFQKTTLESNILTLSDTLSNLVDAESSIRDADFAAESAQLTRAQILVQSGISVLSIANSNPQNVLALLR